MFRPGVDQAAALPLPTYAATAFYHHKLSTQPPVLEPFLREVEALRWVPQKLQANIETHYYESGHMVYVNENVLHKFHDDVAAFVRGTESGK